MKGTVPGHLTAQGIMDIDDFTRAARKLLLDEVSEQLEGIYGLLPTGCFERTDAYPALAQAEARATRARLEIYITGEMAAGLNAAEARARVAREVAFIWLNRLVVFRMMEAFGLIGQSVERGSDSRGFTMWLAEPGNEADLKLYEAGHLPQNALGEGPRDRAYRHYLLHLCRRAAAEIDGLFDADDLPSQMLPRPRALARLLAQLNAPDLAAAWQDEQTIGWVYQYFNGPDLEAFRGAASPKVPAPMIASKTRQFTPRWIIKVLVQNSLGRLWIEMHPDSRLRGQLDYLVPFAERDRAPLRSVSKITLLDPAAGAMHFGLVAFDLFLAMYREELARAGEPGWPARPPVGREQDIPAAIIANNLFGMDIDPRAVQLSALALLLKARRVNPAAAITDHNLACADVLSLNGAANQERRALRLLSRRYDVVATNPPYLDTRDYNPELKAAVASLYPDGKRNLYAAFLCRCLEWLAPQGRLAMISPQSFMFISSFRQLRERLRAAVAIETLVHTGLHTFPGAVVDCAFYVLRREAEAACRDQAIGMYFRLLKESDAEAKRRAFERATARLRDGRTDPSIFRCRQGDFDAVPASPWVYWIGEGIRNLFVALPPLAEVAVPRQGAATSDNFRFLRFWWEVGKDRIQFNCDSLASAGRSGARWFPYMKGGGFRRWYGNQFFVVNWQADGAEMKSVANGKRKKYAPTATRALWSAWINSSDYYFKKGITYSYLTSGRFSARLLPPGFIFDVAGSSVFPNDIDLILGVMNSSLAFYALKLINPTVNFQIGDLGRLPIPSGTSDKLRTLVQRAVAVAAEGERDNEMSYSFIAPPAWPAGAAEVAARRAQMAEIEHQIDEEVYRLYDISETDREAIEMDLAAHPPAADAEDGDETADGEPSEEAGARPALAGLALAWISYAVGIVLGRFAPGEDGALGCGRFRADTARRLRAMGARDGLATLDEGDEDDLALRVLMALETTFGETEAARLVRTALGGDGEVAGRLRNYLRRQFFRRHVRRYRKRPVYWLLESPRRTFAIYLFHERLTRDTLLRLQRKGTDKIALLEARMADLRNARDGAQGRERRQVEKALGELAERQDDLREFAARIKAALDRGYRPHPDDGVLLNLAPLWELIRSWQAEPKQAWQALARGEYDWAHVAMDHWPERVRKKCASVAAYALAHDVEK